MGLIALVDCNNFFVSCERVFNPSLKNEPVVVLSNNDGCAISRSNEAKKLGIKMGEPYFKFRDLVAKHKVQVFSSNFALYSEMSKRVMNVISLFSPTVEYYSVDEAFLELPTNILDVYDFGLKMRQTILDWTGIPVSVGIAKTKTLAKLANELVKSNNLTSGVLDWSHFPESRLNQYLSKILIDDVWGIGRQNATALKAYQVYSVLDFKNLNPDFVKKRFTITGLRTHQELHNISCLKVHTKLNPQKNLIVTRSFGSPTQEKSFVLQALIAHASKAAEKLRQKNLKTQKLTIYISNKKDFHKTYTLDLAQPTNSNLDFIQNLEQALNKIFKPNILYKSAGVFCSNLISADYNQLSLLENSLDQQNKTKLDKILDQVNHKFGQNTLNYSFLGIKNFKQDWQTKQSKKSPAYLSDWNSLVKITS